MSVNPTALSELIRHRRSIKPDQMDGRAIPEEHLAQILENANWAPTHGMTEPWRFTVFRGHDRVALGKFLSETYRELTAPDEFKPSKFEKLSRNPTLAPVVIAIGMKRQVSGKISEIDEVQAVACAVQNMHLTATAYGIGGFWSSNVAACSEQMRDFIGLGTGDRSLGLFYLGYPKGDWPSGKRSPMSDKIRWSID